MAASQVYNLIDATVTALRAQSGLCAPGGIGTPVYDGPVASQDYPTTFIVVGNYGLSDEDEIPEITIDAQWASLPISAGHREETVQLPCAIVSWSGGSDWSAVRTNVETAYDLVASALLTTTAWAALSGVVSIVLTNARIVQVPSDLGIGVFHKFDVEARFRV